MYSTRDRVVFGYENRWTLLKKVDLRCPDCGAQEFSWIVQAKKGQGEIQIWNFDSPEFWLDVVHIKDWPEKEKRLRQYYEAKNALDEAQMEVMRKQGRL